MSNARMTHYQTLLLNRDCVEFAPPAILNPATLLPDSGKEVLHTCQEILAEETGTRQDLQDQPLGGPGLLTWYTDRSSYIMDGKRMAGAAVVDDDRIIWASGLPAGTSPQRAELIALTQALRMAEVNVSKNQAISGKRLRGDRPGAYWEVDFTEIKPAKYGYKYLLVFLDTFSGWTEAFPTKTETAQTVSKKILEEIFPRFGIPKVIGSDNGPAFVAQVSQGLAKILGTDWKLHCAYRPQSSGQVERMNRTLKETLTKLSIETGLCDWLVLLPFALFRVRNTPGCFGLTPFEIMFGALAPLQSAHLHTFPECATNKFLLERLRALEDCVQL
ncbi:uncharacterized protein LOC130683788 [Manis pentadactyla]|uniref:uncharacterized protein LOC130683788 n=1 Tax=Manis pentadactyla TaxID=143292 RepID=UPI00255CFAD6|nr:uncharacterized protein LOC130683788 [Manis pentadactyla]